ncbi:MAG TPA: ABC transporter permease [Nocardioidaceae bacterium]|nr:ABC transporter permease [Nocardioidaceae bacterium]
MTRVKRVLMALLAPLVAVVSAMVITSVVIAVVGDSPVEFWQIIFSAPADRVYVNIVNQSSMIFLSGLAAAIGFRMNLFNIGVEGQYTVAAYAGAVVAGAAFFPGLLNVLLALLAATFAGAFWAGIAGVLKVTRGVSEVISTIMLNAIGLTLVGYLLNNYGQQLGNSRRTAVIPVDSRLQGWSPFLERDGSIWTLGILAILAGVAFSLVLNRTRFGFDLRATGFSEAAATASGVNVARMVVISMLLSGAVAGLVWMPALFGSGYSYGTSFQSGLGFIGIAVALLGRNRPLGIMFGALLFAFLNEQSNRLTLETDISQDIVQITQGVIVLAIVVAYEVVGRYRVAAEQRSVSRRLESDRNNPEEAVSP